MAVLPITTRAMIATSTRTTNEPSIRSPSLRHDAQRQSVHPHDAAALAGGERDGAVVAGLPARSAQFDAPIGPGHQGLGQPSGLADQRVDHAGGGGALDPAPQPAAEGEQVT